MLYRSKLSLVASVAIFGLIFSGCTKEDETISTSTTSTVIPQNYLSKVVGTVSDGPIKNAKVYIDENFNAMYDVGEPMTLTNDNGEFELSFLNQSDTENYVLIAESTETSEDPIDNPGTKLDFLMFSTVSDSAEINLNPNIFKEFLSGYEKFIKNDENLSYVDTNFSSAFISSLDDSDTNLFQSYINNAKTEYKELLKDIVYNIKMNNDNSKLDASLKDELGISITGTVSFSDENLSVLSDSKVYENQTISNVGPLVISKDLQEVVVEENVAVNSANDVDVNEGVSVNTIKVNTGSSYYDGNSSNSMVVLKRPILSPVGTDEVKVLIGNKTSLDQSITIFVTPYDSVLEVPNYSQIQQMGHKVVVGADITIKDPNEKKINISDVNISGVVLDGHTELDASSLSYLYFDGQNWIDNNSSVSDKFVGVNSGFKLAPYVLVEKNALQTVNVTIDALKYVRNPVIIAQGTSFVPSNSLSKRLLFSTLDETSSVLLDAVNVQGVDTVSFKIPENFIIENVIIIDEDLNKINGQKSALIKKSLTNNYTSIADNLNILTNSLITSEVSSGITNFIDTSFVFNNLSFPNITYSNDNAVLAQEIIAFNIENFLGETNSKEFYNGGITKLSWGDTTKQYTFEATDNKLIYIENILDYYTEDTVYTKTTTLDFSNSIKVRLSVSDSYNPDHKYGVYGDSENTLLVYEYTKQGARNIDNYYSKTEDSIIVNFKESKDYTTKRSYGDESRNYNTYETRNVEGVASVQLDENGFVDSIIKSKLQISKDSYEDGAQNNKYFINGVLEQNASSFDIDADFEVKTDSYGNVLGHMVSVNSNYTKLYQNGVFENSNLLSTSSIVYSTTNTYLADVTKFSQEWLNQRVLYSLYLDSSNIYRLDKITFTDSNFEVEPFMNSSNSLSKDYQITSDGYVSYENNSGQTEYIRPMPASSTSDSIKVIWNTDVSDSNLQYRYLFLDKEKALSQLYSKALAQVVPLSGSYVSSNCSGGQMEVNTQSSWISSAYTGSLLQDGVNITLNTSDGTNFGTGVLTLDGATVTIDGSWSIQDGNDLCSGTWSVK
jgi:hypothetical protein